MWVGFTVVIFLVAARRTAALQRTECARDRPMPRGRWPCLRPVPERRAARARGVGWKFGFKRKVLDLASSQENTFLS
jgi:hypothetical protein